MAEQYNVVNLSMCITYEYNKLEFFGPGKPFLFSLMYTGNAGTYPSGDTFRCSTLELATGLTYKH